MESGEQLATPDQNEKYWKEDIWRKNVCQFGKNVGSMKYGFATVVRSADDPGVICVALDCAGYVFEN
jgi:hypothetical protein